MTYQLNPSLSAKNTSPPFQLSQAIAHPNNSIHYQLFTPHSFALPADRLKPTGWEKLTAHFPDRHVTQAIMGICRYGARIGFQGIWEAPTIHPNLATAQADTNQVMADIKNKLNLNRLLVSPDTLLLLTNYTPSPPGLTDKSDGSKRRIHHLSYPTNTTSSINGGIPEGLGAIAYSSMYDAIRTIQNIRVGSLLMKRDFESTFRHITVFPLDSPLLCFQWRGKYSAELFLPFRLRTAPYLFKLFSEIFHWILEEES